MCKSSNVQRRRLLGTRGATTQYKSIWHETANLAQSQNTRKLYDAGSDRHRAQAMAMRISYHENRICNAFDTPPYHAVQSGGVQVLNLQL